MSLSTLTFETLRQRSERDLQNAEFQPGVAAEQEDTRTEIGGLLDDRSHIESLASTQEQRESYGVENFHRDFVMLRTCQSDRNCPHEGEAFRNFVWSCVPHCPFKRFQELFCHEHQFAVPHYTIQPNKRLWFTRDTNFHQMSLAACQVSPDRISDDFAQNTGLCTFEESDSPLIRLEKKKKAIPRLKLMFESAVPLQKGHQRLLQVETPHPLTEKRYGATVPRQAVGSILYTRENGNGNGGEVPKKNAPVAPRRLIVSHFTSANAALRKTAHEREGYDIEQVELLQLKDEIAALNRRCDREWRGQIPVEKKNALVAEAQELLTRGHQLLEHCVHKDKRFADARMERCGELLTKHNVSAAMTTMVGALNHLGHRLEDVTPKQGHNDQDRITLQRHITEQELLIKEVRRNIADAAHGYNGDANITNATMLGIYALDLSRISLQPLRTYADRISEKLVMLDRALLKHEQDSAKQSLVQMHVIGKFQAARTCFEHIKLWIAEGRRVPVDQVQQFVGKLNTIFAKREVYPEMTIDGYEEPFQDMQNKLEGIQQNLVQYAAKPMTGEEHEEMEQWLREYLDTFDLEEIVKKLP
jgi:hypothetical protein